MSNRNDTPSYYANFHPGLVRTEGNADVHHVAMDLPGGREAMVSLKIGHDDAGDLQAQRDEFFANVYPPGITEPLEREIEQLTQQYIEITGYDRDGNAQHRVTGRPRELLEMKLANRRNALVLAQHNRRVAEQYQAGRKAARLAQEQRIAEAAQAQAQELIEQHEIDRLAHQIAARAGVR